MPDWLVLGLLFLAVFGIPYAVFWLLVRGENFILRLRKSRGKG